MPVRSVDASEALRRADEAGRRRFQDFPPCRLQAQPIEPQFLTDRNAERPTRDALDDVAQQNVAGIGIAKGHTGIALGIGIGHRQPQQFLARPVVAGVGHYCFDETLVTAMIIETAAVA